jgi:hypothetical protein
MSESFVVRLLGRGIVASMGVGVLLGGLPSSASAATTVNPGTDYLVTPPGGAFYPPFSFSGLPIGVSTPKGPTPPNPNGGFLGFADTIVNRLDPVQADADGGVTNIEIVGLSLKSQQPAEFMGGMYEAVAGLQKYYSQSGALSTGTMTIRDSGEVDGKRWDSDFTINGLAFAAPVGSLPTPGDDAVRTLIEAIQTPIPANVDQPYACKSGDIDGYCLLFAQRLIASNEPWVATPEPEPFTLQGLNLVDSSPANFFLTGVVRHDNQGVNDITKFHKVQPYPAPGPLPVFGATAAFAFARRLRVRTRKVRQEA